MHLCAIATLPSDHTIHPLPARCLPSGTHQPAASFCAARAQARSSTLCALAALVFALVRQHMTRYGVCVHLAAMGRSGFVRARCPLTPNARSTADCVGAANGGQEGGHHSPQRHGHEDCTPLLSQHATRHPYAGSVQGPKVRQPSTCPSTHQREPLAHKRATCRTNCCLRRQLPLHTRPKGPHHRLGAVHQFPRP